MITKKLGILLILGVLGLTACGETSEDSTFEAPDQPAVRLASAELTVEGAQTVTCWPQGEGNVVCDVVVAEPATSLDVAAGDVVTVVLEGDLGAPSQVVVTSQERDADGNPLINVGLGADNSFLITNLTEGEHLLEITTYYDDVAGEAGAITSVFAVNVSGQAVAIDPTPSLSPDDADATATAIAVLEASPDGDAFAPTLTAEAEIDLTATAIADATATTGDDITPTTSDDGGMQDGATATALAETEEAADVTTEPDDATTEPASTTPPADVTDTAPDEPTATFTPMPTNTVTPSVTPTLPPTDTPAPTATSTPQPSPTPTADQAMTLRVSGTAYLPVGVTLCEGTGDTQSCEETANLDAVRVQAQIGSAVNVLYNGERPLRMNYSILDRQTFQPLVSGSRGSSNAYLFNVEVSEAGLYVLSIELVWADRTATYYYQIFVRS